MPEILSIDPGNATGVALYTFAPNYPEFISQFTSREVRGGLESFVREVHLPNYDAVFIEDFIVNPLTHTKTRQPAAYEILGYVKGVCLQMGTPVYWYSPAEHTKHSLYKEKEGNKVKALGWSFSSKDDHADSAASIMLLGLKRNYYEHYRELLRSVREDD
jgi:hypothetical protein